MQNSPPISLEELRAALRYDADNGLFTWLRSSRRAKSGDRAGHIAADGRITIGINGTVVKAHRLAWFHHYGIWPTSIMDHADGNPTNNSIRNLRLATFSQNAANSAVRNSLPKGVAFVKGRYRASITVNYRRIYLGVFDTPSEAGAAYGEAALQHFGGFARCR